jgi:hypothetical protein
MSEETSSVEEFIDAIAAQNFNKAKDHFDAMIGDRVVDALDAEKKVVADSIFNDAEVSEEDFDIEEFEDEEDTLPEIEDLDVEDTEDEVEDDTNELDDIG